MARPTNPFTHVLVFAGLLALLGLAVASWQLRWGTWAALGIASAKAALIAAFFMHLDRTSPLQRFFASVGLTWLVILVGLTLSDYFTRGWG